MFSFLAGSFTHQVQAQSPTVTTISVATEEQSGEQGWSQPVNLSRSGAASQPRIVASPDGKLQAFWIDRFDGLMTSIYNGSVWSFPVMAPFPPRRGGQKPIIVDTAPFLLTDSLGRIHAFWYGEKDSKTGEPPLNYSQMFIGSISWSATQQVAESALVFDVAVTETDELVVGYIRTLKTDEIPPGVYFRSTTNKAQYWKPGSAVYNSIYFRILPLEAAYLRVASLQGTAFMVWSEPRLGEILYSDSLDGGATWEPPSQLGIPDDRPSVPRLAILPQGEVFRTWQASAQSGCVLYQQQLTIQNRVAESSAPAPTIPAGLPTYTPPPPVTLSEWSRPSRILEGTEFCPQSDHFWLHNTSLLWVWGEGSSRFNVSAWDASSRNWSIPQILSFSFEEPESQRPVQLDDLHATMAADKLAVTGKDPGSNEIWITTSQVSTLELIYAPPSSWIPPLRISSEEQTTSNLTIAIDLQGRVHMVWVQGIGLTGASLFYAHFDDGTASPPSEIVRSASGEFLRQPALTVDSEDRLHLVWSGGEADQVYYSRAEANQAGSASGWLPARALSDAVNVSRPQIATDNAGRLLVLYAVPVNEQRGIYLVRSDDGGEIWSAPESVFDAAAADWNVVDHPTLVVTPDGILHVAWVQTQLPGTGFTLGIFYTRSILPLSALPFVVSKEEETGANPVLTPTPMDSNSTSSASNWIEPWELAPANSDWPRLAILKGSLHLLYANEEGLNHRWLSLTQQTPDGGGWGSLSRVPGWQSLREQGSVSSDRPPFDLAVDSQTLHLISAIPGSVDLRYSALKAETDSASGNRWSQPEIYHPIGNWINKPGGVMSAPLTGGALAIAWLASPPTVEGVIEVLPAAIYFTSRTIPTVEAPPALPPLPTVTPTLEPTPSPTDVPSPTPPLSMEPTPSESPISPLALGGGLAAVIVIAIFTGILLRGKKP
jgi:hypothetical protein